MTLAIFCWVGFVVACTIAEKTHKNTEKLGTILIFGKSIIYFLQILFYFSIQIVKKHKCIIYMRFERLKWFLVFQGFYHFFGYCTCYNKTNPAENSQGHKLSFRFVKSSGFILLPSKNCIFLNKLTSRLILTNFLVEFFETFGTSRFVRPSRMIIYWEHNSNIISKQFWTVS